VQEKVDARKIIPRKEIVHQGASYVPLGDGAQGEYLGLYKVGTQVGPCLIDVFFALAKTSRVGALFSVSVVDALK